MAPNSSNVKAYRTLKDGKLKDETRLSCHDHLGNLNVEYQEVNVKLPGPGWDHLSMQCVFIKDTVEIRD